VNVSPPSRRPRVMLGDLGPMERLGMRRLLDEDGIEIVGDPLTSLSDAPEVQRLRPDVVVLDLDGTDSQHLSELVRLNCPQAKVVLWARTEDVLEVLDPGATRPRWVVAGVPEDLLAELSALHENRLED
jgi:DNA-binding NarL/FixJ family response regulator